MAATAQSHRQQGGGQGAGGGIPFSYASFQDSEAFYTQNTVFTTAAQEQTPVNVLPGGFLRGIWLQVVAAGGTLSTGRYTQFTGSPGHPRLLLSFLQKLGQTDVTQFGRASGATPLF